MTRLSGGLLGALLLAAALGPGAASSFAAPGTRAYDSQITGFKAPQALTVDADGRVWISDVQAATLSTYDPYPSQTELASRTGGLVWGGSQKAHSVAVSAVNDYLYVGTDEQEQLIGVGTSVKPRLGIVDNFGDVYRIFETTESESPKDQIWVAVDNNPQDDAYGRLYRYTAEAYGGGSRIEMFDGYGEPVDFTGSAGYISGNQITGTPAGSFSTYAAGAAQPEMPGMTVDSEGNIWVIDVDKREIDEFSPSGEFVQRITQASSGAPATTTGNPLGSRPYGGGAAGLGGIAVDPTNGDVVVGDLGGGVLWEFSPQGKFIGQIDGSETPAGHFGFDCVTPDFGAERCIARIAGLAFNSAGYLYVTDGADHVVDIFKPRPVQPTIAYKPYDNPTPTSVTLHAAIGLNGGGSVTDCEIAYGPTPSYGSTKDCEPEKAFATDKEVSAQLTGLSPEQTYHYRVEVSNANGTRIGQDRTFTPHNVLDLRAEPATGVAPEEATIHGSFVGNGAHTHYWFEYGKTTTYGTKAPLPVPPGGDAGSPAGPGRTAEELHVTGLSPVTRYHYRIVAENGSLSDSEDESFRTGPLLPQGKTEFVTDVHSEQAMLHGQVNPGGGDTTYYFEYGTEDCANLPDPCSPAGNVNVHVGADPSFHNVTEVVKGLQQGTTYYYRTAATNSTGTGYGPVRTFSTYPFSTELKDPCPNALARQQTGAALLSDCRAYELVSSAHAGGYDVESTLVPGQEPFEGYPRAENPPRVLYGVHNGAIPGVSGNPTNHGVDPYVATRGENGWTTSYVGLPADNPNATSPFASTLLEADPSLDTFAFGGSSICSPCFADGTSGTPLHLPDGELVQGMQGSLEPEHPTDEGLVKKRFSADGTHFVFSSTSQFEPTGNPETGDVSIYDRDLETGITQVVSTDPSGNNLSCPQGTGQCHAPGDAAGISELGISEDGSRIVVGQKLTDDADGNSYYHLYMHLGTNSHSVDLTPGAGAGALFDGMTEDGSKVFFTTKDKLLGTDIDNSADIYEAAVSAGGTLTLRLVTTHEGAPSNDDGCSPPGIPTNWNAASGEGKCNAVAFAGGAGVASGSGTLYFLSPELLDSAAEAEGEEGEPNLYVETPGSDPEFVATIDTSATKPPPPPPGRAASTPDFLSGLSRPEAIAVDQNSGDVYVVEAEAGAVSRWTSKGKPHNFTGSGGHISGNRITGGSFGSGEGQVAVDSSNSPFEGDFYVTTNAGGLKVYAENGVQLGELTGFNEACGVAVDQSNGDLYVGSYPSEVRRFRPVSATPPVSNASYEQVEGIEVSGEPCNIDASAEGHVYTWPYSGGQIKQFPSSALTKAPFPSPAGTAFATGARMQSDPNNGDVYVDKGNKIVQYNSSGSEIEAFGSSALDGESRGVGVNGNTERIYASDGSSVIEFAYPPPYEPIDNPAAVHAVKQAGTHDYGDFQVTPSGEFATFTTRQPLDTEFNNLGHSEVYRYDGASQTLDCVSCPATNVLASGDASLASKGLGLTDDGRVFFDTEEAIVLRDGDNREDVYEWEEEGVGPSTGGCAAGSPNLFPTGICLSLISTGNSQFDSSLLSASANGTDVFFFTHDTLAHGDENGPVTKIYDARTNGGVFEVPPPALCAASDECHGPGTRAAEIPPIRTKAELPGNPTTTHCKKGFVKTRGKCVRPKHHKHHHHRRAR